MKLDVLNFAYDETLGHEEAVKEVWRRHFRGVKKLK